MVFLQSIQSILSIILLIALGYFLKRRKMISEDFGGNIAGVITKIALPASIFVSVLHYLDKSSLISLSGALVFPAVAIVIGYAIAYALVKLLKIRKGRRGVFMNAVVNANTIFIGLPLNVALFGEKSLPYFLVYYVCNTVSTWAFGVFLISNDDPTAQESKSGHKINISKLLPPPLLGFIVALAFLLLSVPIPQFVNATLTYVVNLVTPLSLIYIWIILFDSGIRNITFDKDTIAALIGRFVISPLVAVAVIYAGTKYFGYDMATLLRQTLIVQSATPALAVLPILAAQAHGDVKYATGIVASSTILFVIVIPILMQLV